MYASPDRKVPPQLRELGQTRAGWLVGSQFVFSQHCKSCRALGFPEEKIEALKNPAEKEKEKEKEKGKGKEKEKDKAKEKPPKEKPSRGG